jgi:hypothetical protein
MWLVIIILLYEATIERGIGMSTAWHGMAQHSTVWHNTTASQR